MLLGWVHRVRDLGSLVFLDIRDRHGITQVVARDDDRCCRRRQAAAPGVRRRRAGPRRAALARVGEPEGRRPARSRSRCASCGC